MRSHPKVFWNSLCPICRAGVPQQRPLMEVASESAEWSDINQHPEALADIRAGVEAVRLRPHVRDADGRLAVGAAAFAALWRQTPAQRKLGRLLALPAIRTLATLLYDAFTHLLHARNRRCRRWQSAPARRRIPPVPP